MQRQFIVNGEIMARYGQGLDAKNPRTAASTPRTDRIREFATGYQRIDEQTNGGVASQGSRFTLQSSQSLAQIAKAVYGDAAMWWKVALANPGVAGATAANAMNPNAVVAQGTSLLVSSSVGSVHNSAETSAMYDPGRAISDLSAVVPPPQGDASSGGGGRCGGFGQIIAAVIAVAVTIYTGDPSAGNTFFDFFSTTLGLGKTAATAATYAAAAATGSAASQAFNIAIGAQNGFNWKNVALSAISGGIGGGLEASGLIQTGNATLNTVARAAITSAGSQAIGVITGLQPSFNWKGVVASALGAGVGQALGEQLGTIGAKGFDKFGERTFAALASGTVTALAGGGKVSVQQIAVNAFGQVVGQGLGELAQSPQTSDPLGAFMSDKLASFNDRQIALRGEDGGGARRMGQFVSGGDVTHLGYHETKQNDMFEPYETADGRRFRLREEDGVVERLPRIVRGDRIEVTGSKTPSAEMAGASAAWDMPDSVEREAASLLGRYPSIKRMPDLAPTLGLSQLGDYLNPITRLQGFAEGFSPIESLKGLKDLVTSPLDTLEKAGLQMQESTRQYFLQARQGNFAQAARYEGQIIGGQAAGTALGVGIGAAGGLALSATRAVRAGIRTDVQASAFLADQARSVGAPVPRSALNQLANGGPTVQASRIMGKAREEVALAQLQEMYPGAQILRERMLRNADGSKAIDFGSGQGRRLDFVVVKDGKVLDVVEVTSQTANKRMQLAKEARIREDGGTFIRPGTGQPLVDVSAFPSRVLPLK